MSNCLRCECDANSHVLIPYQSARMPCEACDCWDWIPADPIVRVGLPLTVALIRLYVFSHVAIIFMTAVVLWPLYAVGSYIKYWLGSGGET